ncbi:hypothetical protein [Streptomyces sp. NPDC001843]|uniref:hypothetical protein n=1 Tax=Streptomyces sp. NPDC001843 TaxID=3364617 RepID=UPI00369A2483
MTDRPVLKLNLEGLSDEEIDEVLTLTSSLEVDVRQYAPLGGWQDESEYYLRMVRDVVVSVKALADLSRHMRSRRENEPDAEARFLQILESLSAMHDGRFSIVEEPSDGANLGKGFQYTNDAPPRTDRKEAVHQMFRVELGPLPAGTVMIWSIPQRRWTSHGSGAA